MISGDMGKNKKPLFSITYAALGLILLSPSFSYAQNGLSQAKATAEGHLTAQEGAPDPSAAQTVLECVDGSGNSIDLTAPAGEPVSCPEGTKQIYSGLRFPQAEAPPPLPMEVEPSD